MPITPENAGRTYPPAPPYRVSRAKIAEFAIAVGDNNPAYFSDRPIAPPTFAAVIAAQAWGALFDDAEFGLALHRTMHGDQSFEIHRPLREGDDVVARLTIERVRNRGNLDMVSIAVDLSVDGQTAVTARSTLMHTQEARHD
ncbi:MaoC family dehydratase N-terminal domain-containing protein [Tessaracoccus sp. OS52]|uniref:FAS1-like dehydratase domain-containing protein n=1 Tax=Tessaracoccus sp. OS52 TaxID=2886691 RepID=UPI001D0F8116|nr:MaoC family dehydratase N-terminal domain-containing protein [Tessaracoccus sp. OS52]MCC2592170.1 MaoC family dehydratase N-terminal domain-containing protein [Tessaracoccus sp. OS52]